MYKGELRACISTLIRRGLQIDLTGNTIDHTHTKIDSSAPRPPMKFHLCTRESRPEGRMVQTDIDAIGRLCWRFIQNNGLDVRAVASVPKVGDEIAKAIQLEVEKNGIHLPLLRFSKYQEDGVSYIGPLVDNDKYPQGQSVWLVDDVVHKGLSKMRTIEQVRKAGYRIAGILVFMDYDQGARKYFARQGIRLVSVVTLRSVLQVAREKKLITKREFHAIHNYLDKTRGVAAA